MIGDRGSTRRPCETSGPVTVTGDRRLAGSNCQDLWIGSCVPAGRHCLGRSELDLLADPLYVCSREDQSSSCGVLYRDADRLVERDLLG